MKNHLLRACAAIGLGVLAVACTQTPGTGTTTTTSSTTTSTSTSTVPNSPPVAVLSPSTTSGVAPLTVSFDGSGSTDDDSIVSYDWNFGDVVTATGPNASHTYEVAGTYVASLEVTDNDGATDIATVTITVTDDPTGRYVATTGTDAGACQASASPCLTLGYAVTQAATNDTVHVAAGTYPELVTVNKSLTFKGANAGIHAGAAAGTRGAESIVKGFRNPGNPGSVLYSLTLDGFRIDPQGDATLLAATGQPLVWIKGGPTVAIVNNVMSGGPFVSNCTFTCTTMTDYAITVQAGNISIADNRIENFRRPVNVTQTASAAPITSSSITNNVMTGITSRAISVGQATGQNTMAGTTVSGNQIDAVGRTAPSSPAGITITNRGNVIDNNTFTALSTGVYLDRCKKFSQHDNKVTNNTFTNNNFGVLIPIDPDGGQCVSGASVGAGGWVTDGASIDGLAVTGNNFIGTAVAAIQHTGSWGSNAPAYSNGPIDTSCNYYGDATGPTNASNPSGTGGAVVTAPTPDVQFTITPWRTAAAPGGACDGTP